MASAGTVALALTVGISALASVTAMEVDASTIEDAALRTLSFSPWGAVMLWMALSVRKAITAFADKWDEFLALLRVNAEALKGLSDAQLEAAMVQREAINVAREDRPRTDPHVEYTPPGRRPKSQHPR